jgi:hypothetical protein
MDAACVADRVAALDWKGIAGELDTYGAATTVPLLAPQECAALAALYGEEMRFRSRVVMARHGFGQGEYQYFAYPLPDLVAELRQALYPRLAPVADRWNELMGIDTRFPATHQAFLERCHAAGQRRPTPLLLSYLPGDFNCLHQDVYGEHLFPLQVAFLLSAPGRSPSSARASSRAPRSCRWPRARVSSSPCASGRSGAAAAPTASTSATASAACAPASAARWA